MMPMLIRQMLAQDAVDDAVTALLSPGIWAVGAGCNPPDWHDPALLLSKSGYVGAMAISLGTAVIIGLNLGLGLIERLHELGSAPCTLAGLALHELLVNAIVHGNLGVRSGRSDQWQDLAQRGQEITAALRDPVRAARAITVAVGWTANALDAAIADEGDGYDLTPTSDTGRGSGRGIRIARMAGCVDVRRGGRLTTIRFSDSMPKGDPS